MTSLSKRSRAHCDDRRRRTHDRSCDTTQWASPESSPFATLRDKGRAATLYGSPSLWLAHPTFYPATGGNKGYFSYLSVLEADDVELSVLLVSDSEVGDVEIQPGAALAGVQRVPVSVPSAGCWTLALSVPNRAPLVVTIEVG